MPPQSFENIILSYATYVPAGVTVPTGSATYIFFTEDYQPPEESRYIDSDIVKNQNGKFKYVYDNGPGFKRFGNFKIHCENQFTSILGASAAQQYNNLKALWDHPGVLQLRAPDGIYTVHWGDSLERSFRVFPKKSGDLQEYIVTVQFEEGQ